MKSLRASLTLAIACAILACVNVSAGAQSANTRIIVPFAAGSVLDTQARFIAEGLTQRWGKSVIVENVAGSGGNTGAERFSRSAPDGNTLFAAPPAPFTVNRLLYKSIGYDASKFMPVSLMSTVPNALIVRKDFPAKDVPEFLAYARANAGKVSYASQGIGTTPFLIAKRLEVMTGVSMNHVPYRGSALAMNDIAAGHIDSFFDAISNALSLTQSGSSRILAVTDTKRSPLLPDVPTMEESIPGFRSLTWFAIAAPPGTPAELAQKISADVAAVIASPAINKRFIELGLTPVGGTPAELAKFIAEEDAIWSELVVSLKMEPQ